MSFAELTRNDFIVVEFAYEGTGGIMSKKQFVGTALLFNNGSIRCLFLRKSTQAQNIYVFPNVPAVAEIKLNQVVKNMGPLCERRGNFCFQEGLLI